MKIFACLLALTSLVSGAPHSIIPLPAEVEMHQGTLQLRAQTAARSAPDLRAEADYLLAGIGVVTGYEHIFMPLTYRHEIPGAVILKTDSTLEKGHHQVLVTAKGATISGHDAEAVFHGVQTFLQLMPAERTEGFLNMPCCLVKDHAPTGPREVQLDVARSIIPNDDLKRYIDLLALHKFNRLSLVLNDDQGWRLESKKYPKLATIGSVRASTPPYGDRFGSDDEEYGGFYPQEIIRGLVSYAKSRHIEIVPVISLPAHVSAALAAYPELGNSDLGGDPPIVRSDWADSPHLLAPKIETFTFIDDILTEVASLFPSSVIGLNNHQPSLDEWKKSPAAQAYLKENKLADEAALWDHFLAHASATIKKLERTPRLESAQTTLRLDQYQRPEAEELEAAEEREAAGGLLTVSEVYQSQPAIAVLPTPYMHDLGKVCYMSFPRLAALSELHWTPEEKRSPESFSERLPSLLAHYKKRGIPYGVPYQRPVRAALHGTTVTTSLGHYLEHWPELAFDGKKETIFWSDRALKKDDHLTLTFPHPISGEIEVATGGDASDDGAALADGVLEVSPDGKTWDALAEFLDGLATVNAPAGTIALRIRATGPQEEALIIHEIVLSEPLLPVKLSETRRVQFPKLAVQPEAEAQAAEITFRCDFSAHPEFREKVRLLRARYFSLWPRAGNFFGVIGQLGTPDTLSIAFGKETSLSDGILTFSSDDFAKKSPEEIEGEFISYFCAHLQNYADGAPNWFASGLTTITRAKELPDSAWTKALPESPKKSDAVTGGAASAAFLNWVIEKYEAFPLAQVSMSCRRKYQARYWSITTGKSLEELVAEYQK